MPDFIDVAGTYSQDPAATRFIVVLKKLLEIPRGLWIKIGRHSLWLRATSFVIFHIIYIRHIGCSARFVVGLKRCLWFAEQLEKAK